MKLERSDDKMFFLFLYKIKKMCGIKTIVNNNNNNRLYQL